MVQLECPTAIRTSALSITVIHFRVSISLDDHAVSRPASRKRDVLHVGC